jgi:hypothetical protein
MTNTNSVPSNSTITIETSKLVYHNGDYCLDKNGPSVEHLTVIDAVMRLQHMLEADPFKGGSEGHGLVRSTPERLEFALWNGNGDECGTRTVSGGKEAMRPLCLLTALAGGLEAAEAALLVGLCAGTTDADTLVSQAFAARQARMAARGW